VKLDYRSGHISVSPERNSESNGAMERDPDAVTMRICTNHRSPKITQQITLSKADDVVSGHRRDCYPLSITNCVCQESTVVDVNRTRSC
jgi:hypothetical protein